MAQPSSASISEKLNVTTLTDIEHEYHKELGRGAYGVVYTAKYCGFQCAAKKIHSILVDDGVEPEVKEAMKNSFIRECYQCSILSHPNIVTLFGVHYPDQSGIPVMIMELMDVSLTKYIEQNEKVAMKKKIGILLDVAQGLSYLHTLNSPVIHRDLSPNNILLKRLAGSDCLWVAKLADMGVAKAINPNVKKLQRLTKAPGTADFMPPEVLPVNPTYDTSLDVFSFGGIILFVATHLWPTPTTLAIMDPVSDKIIAFTEVERRKKYLDIMTGEVKVLKSQAISCLDNKAVRRPSIVAIVKDLELLKQESDKTLSTFKKTSSHSQIQQTVSMPVTGTTDLLEQYPWFVSFTYNEAEGALNGMDDGVFFVREMKESDNTEYEICIRWKDKTHHIKIYDRQSSGLFSITDEKSFVSLSEMVDHYQEHSLGSHFSDIDTTLACPFWGQYNYHYSTQSTDQDTTKELSKPRKGGTIRKMFTTILHRRNSSEEFPPPSSHKSTIVMRHSTSQGDSIGQPESSSAASLETSNVYEMMDMFPTDLGVYKKPKPSEVVANDKILAEKELWYYGDISRAIAIQMLKEDGDFLLRFAENKKCFVLTTKCDGTSKHFIVRKMEDHDGPKYSFEGKIFSSVSALIKYHVETQVPITKQSQAVLKRPVSKNATSTSQSAHTISHDNVILDQQPLGVGFLGEMFTAILKDSGVRVCVKRCSSGSNNSQLFLNEAEVLKQLNHHNIVKLLGMYADTETMYTVTESLPGGNFLHYLQKRDTKHTPYRLLRYSLDAAQGMEYAASQKYIHRDLASRNGWIDRNLKISGFGLCRKAEDGHCPLTSDDRQIPAKWTAPEVFNTYQFTGACDVWSYGVLLFEIFSSGLTPYLGMKNAQAREFVEQGHRMEAPEGTPKEVYEIMSKCWLYEPEKRPTFSEIVTLLKTIIAKIIDVE